MIANVEHAGLHFALRFDVYRESMAHLAMPTANGVCTAWCKGGAVKRGLDQADKDAQRQIKLFAPCAAWLCLRFGRCLRCRHEFRLRWRAIDVE